eukprot:gnl/MRDRNA2_/MRDRNA2_159422_c0_seq1.p1 gnl/MRDRNA2_/MRDRNA2_159422_c0~~gnl/MRDRNA2_/MRDRNA2_159422_c0_seq1.p1  ORF type:complete len:558 (-),score=82.44 gnl/MRDRNA2_/MRDRNA2_159422_c0_seq1:60-1733(-)
MNCHADHAPRKKGAAPAANFDVSQQKIARTLWWMMRLLRSALVWIAIGVTLEAHAAAAAGAFVYTPSRTTSFRSGALSSLAISMRISNNKAAQSSISDSVGGPRSRRALPLLSRPRAALNHLDFKNSDDRGTGAVSVNMSSDRHETDEDRGKELAFEHEPPLNRSLRAPQKKEKRSGEFLKQEALRILRDWQEQVLCNLKQVTQEEPCRLPFLVLVKLARLGWFAEAAAHDPISFYRTSFLSSISDNDLYAVLDKKDINGVVTGLAEVVFVLCELFLISIERELSVREALSLDWLLPNATQSAIKWKETKTTVNNMLDAVTQSESTSASETMTNLGDSNSNGASDNQRFVLSKQVQRSGYSTFVLVRLVGNPLTRLFYAYACLADPDSTTFAPNLLQWLALPFIAVQTSFGQNILPLLNLLLSFFLQWVDWPDLVKKAIEQTSVGMLPNEAVHAAETAIWEEVINPRILRGELDSVVCLPPDVFDKLELASKVLTHPEQLAVIFAVATVSIAGVLEAPLLLREWDKIEKIAKQEAANSFTQRYSRIHAQSILNCSNI